MWSDKVYITWDKQTFQRKRGERIRNKLCELDLQSAGLAEIITLIYFFFCVEITFIVSIFSSNAQASKMMNTFVPILMTPFLVKNTFCDFKSLKKRHITKD